MRRGFTMVELIFVIVIIGILVSIAMPKLAASRDDAAIYANLASLKQAISNAKTSYISDPLGAKNKGYLGKTYASNSPGQPDGACFDVYIDTSKRVIIQTHKNQPTYSTCSLDATSQDELFQLALDQGLISTTTTTSFIKLGRKIKL